MMMTIDKKMRKHHVKDNDDKKTVYLSLSGDNHCQTLSWLKIDSVSDSTSFRFDPVPEMEIPEHLALHNMYGYACVSYASKVYFICGAYNRRTHHGNPYSNKVFTYDLYSQTWDRLKDLNVARDGGHVAVITPNRFIYVFGGKMWHSAYSQATWIEWYNLRDETSGWRFVDDKKSYPPEALLEQWRYILWHAVDERRSRVLIYAHNQDSHSEQVFSFDYVERNWSELPLKLERPYVHCSPTQFTIQQDLLIWQSMGTIWGYDLSDDTIVLKYSFEHLDPRFGDRQNYSPVYLLCVAKNKLLLLWRDLGDYTSERRYEIYCRQYIIEENSWKDSSCSSSKNDLPCYDLVLDGSESYTTQGFGVHTCLLV